MTRKKSDPVVISLPDVTEARMKAICSLASALEQVSKALNDYHIKVEISNCNFTTSDSMPAISVKLSEEK